MRIDPSQEVSYQHVIPAYNLLLLPWPKISWPQAIKIIKTIQIVKIINTVLIQITYINIIFMGINFSSKKKALNNVSKHAFILVIATMGEIESKVGARLGWLPVTWSRFL